MSSSSPSPSTSRSGFRNAVRIRRNSNNSSGGARQSQSAAAGPSDEAGVPSDIGPFELQVVERAVQDEQQEQQRRARHPTTRPQYQRKSSLLEEIVRQDRHNASGPRSSGSESKPKPNSGSGSGPATPSFGRLNTARSRDVDAAAAGGNNGLTVLHEGDESAHSPQNRAPTYPQGAHLSATHSAPGGRPRPDLVHSGPSNDRLRGLAPGPRISSAARSSTAAAPQQQQQQQRENSASTGTRAWSTSSSSNSSDHRDETPNVLPKDTQQPAAAASAAPAQKEGIFSSLMRRGTSYTLPTSKRSSGTDQDGKRVGSPADGNDPDNATSDERERDGGDDSDSDMHEDGVVDYLDVVDAEVGVLNHMSNIQNSIFIPHIPGLYDRRTTHATTATPAANSAAATRAAARRRSRVSQDSGSLAAQLEEGRLPADRQSPAPGSIGGGENAAATKPGMLNRMTSALSLTGGRKKVDEAEAAQHFSKWADMNEDQRNELDEHVKFLLSRPQKFRRGLRGFGKWARTPMGFIMLSYGIAITGWGIVIMLFIWKWINLHDPVRQRWWIEICDQVLCALFAAVGLGFAPFRAVDTWRMCYIAHYHHLSWKRREQFNLPGLPDRNDLPRPKGYNEAFPPPAPLDLIAEEDGEMLSPRGSASRSAPGSVSNLHSGRFSRQNSDVEDRSPAHESTYSGRDPASPGSGPRSSTASTRPSAVAQAISNANPPTAHRWWQIRSKQQRQDAKQAAGAAHQAVQSLSPNSSSHKVNQGENTEVNTQNGDDATPANEKSSSSPAANGGPPQSRPQLRGAAGDSSGPPALRRNVSIMSELEKDREDVVVLTPHEQHKLNHHQRKFHQSHTFYRYHETATHRAFPLDLMIVIVCLLDCHSLLQGCLGGVTWGIRYHHRPTALTASLITCSLSCNAVAGFLIYLGGRRTKKVDEVHRRLRIALEEEAYRELVMIRKRREEDEEMRRVLNQQIGPPPVRSRTSLGGNGHGGGSTELLEGRHGQSHQPRQQRRASTPADTQATHEAEESSSPHGSTRALL